MQEPELNIIEERCQNLRWKGIFLHADASTADAEHFWCVKSAHALGPDGKLVDKYECNPARGCYSAV